MAVRHPVLAVLAATLAPVPFDYALTLSRCAGTSHQRRGCECNAQHGDLPTA